MESKVPGIGGLGVNGSEVPISDDDALNGILKPYGASFTGYSIVGKGGQFNLCTDNTSLGACTHGDLFCKLSMHPNFRGKFETLVLNGVPVECEMLNSAQMAVINAAVKDYRVAAEFAYVARDRLYVSFKFDKAKRHIANILNNDSNMDDELVNGVRKALYDAVVKCRPAVLRNLSFTKLVVNGKEYVSKA